MKKLPYLIVALLIVLTACAAPAPSGPPDAPAPVQTIPLTGGETGEPTYYGTFRVTSCVFAPRSSLPMEKARQYLNSTVTYGPDSVSNSLGDSCGEPDYREQTVTAADFSAGYNGVLDLEDVNLSGEQVTCVTLENAGMFGSSFYVRNAGSLVIPLDGAFFLAQQVEN